jgi:hypothetical protein
VGAMEKNDSGETIPIILSKSILNIIQLKLNIIQLLYKEKVLKKKNDAKKNQKLEVDKVKAIVENEARAKAEAEAKVVVGKMSQLNHQG